MGEEKGKRKEKGVKDRSQCTTNVLLWAAPAQLLGPLAATRMARLWNLPKPCQLFTMWCLLNSPQGNSFSIYILFSFLVLAISKAVPGRWSVYVLCQGGCSTRHIITAFDVHTNLPSFICSLPTGYSDDISQHHKKEQRCKEMKFNGFH